MQDLDHLNLGIDGFQSRKETLVAPFLLPKEGRVLQGRSLHLHTTKIIRTRHQKACSLGLLKSGLNIDDMVNQVPSRVQLVSSERVLPPLQWRSE